MLDAASELGYAYYAVTTTLRTRDAADDGREDAGQREELRASRAVPEDALLHGSELNIDADAASTGSWVPRGFDILLASVHSHFNQPRTR